MVLQIAMKNLYKIGEIGDFGVYFRYNTGK